MHARLSRLTLCVVSVSTTLAATSASAAPNTLTLRDAKGDANGINGQGVLPGTGNSSGPVQKADSDVVSVTFASTGFTKTVKGKKVFTCTGLTTTVELAAPAGSGIVYRVLGRGVANASQFWLQYADVATGKTTTIRHNDGSAKVTPLTTEAKLDGNRIVFTVLETDLKSVGEALATFKMSALGADVRTSTGASHAPSWDSIDPDESKSFSPCA